MSQSAIDRDKLMDRVRAAKAYSSTIRNEEHAQKVELAAFMAIFHPEKANGDRLHKASPKAPAHKKGKGRVSKVGEVPQG